MEKIILIFLLIISVSNNSISQSGWIQQNSSCNNTLFSVSFLNLNTGIIVGDNGKILMTRNGGMNWDSLNSTVTETLLSVWIIDSNKILASGTDRTVIKTTNSGMSWYRIAFVYGGYDLNEIQFPNAATGYIASSSGIILKSTNVGESWLKLPHPEPFSDFHSLFFFDANTGYVVGEFGFIHSPILKTTNGGANWTRQESRTNSGLYCIRFANPDTGLICGSGGTRRTTNGGLYWGIIFGAPSSLYSLSYTTNQIAYAVGANGTIVKTTDGGINWVSQPSGTINSLYGVYFIDSLTGYAVGVNGTILKTTTGGVVGITTVYNELPEKYFLFQNYPNPFNPSTNISFDIPFNGFVKIIVYNVLGKEVITLINEFKQAGSYITTFNGANLSSGVYYYKIESGGFIQTKKMLLLK